MRVSLVTATVDRKDELGALLGSLAAQRFKDFEVVIVDQNDDDRLVPILSAYPMLSLLHIRSSVRALSSARNLGLAHCIGEIVGFPDDDCLYLPHTLAMVDAKFTADPALSLLSGPAISSHGTLSSGRWSKVSGPITIANVWTSVIAFNLFIRRDLLSVIGGFDEALGVGARFGSAEETDLTIRVIHAGGKTVYDRTLQVTHPDKQLTPIAVTRAFAYGAGLGRVLRKHKIAKPIASQFFVRPLGGMLVGLARFRLLHVHYYWKTLRGRMHGYFAKMRQ
jgi:glycosyltransferase involved in cell wall biosynthesis